MSMRLNTVILSALDWPANQFDRFREWLKSEQKPATAEPLTKCGYVTCESGRSGYRVILGFATLEEAQDAHRQIARLKTPNR
jgi:hypothetical protein